MHKALPTLVSWIIGLGLLPSFTALSLKISSAFPSLWQPGPANFVKVGSPLIFFYLWQRRGDIARPVRNLFILFIFAITIATVIAGIPCNFPSPLLREWGAICLGLTCGLALTVLPKKSQLLVLSLWGTITFGSALLNLVSNYSIQWLYSNLFDPQTGIIDSAEVGSQALSGIFGRQSMAKMLAWIPFLLLGFSFKYDNTWNPKRLALFVACASFTGLILATTQRGPFIGALTGWIAFSMHQFSRMKKKKMAALGIAGLALSIAINVSVLRNTTTLARLKSIVGMFDQNSESKIAASTVDFRKRLMRVSLKSIKDHPLGNPCIPSAEFVNEQVFQTHSHSLILHQYRERGWIWGTLHLALWILALIGAARKRTTEGSFLFAAIIATLTLGLVDQPWFVINHAMVLGLLLIRGWDSLFRHGPNSISARLSGRP